MKINKFKQHKYPHFQYNLHDVEIAYQNGVKAFNSMSKDERIKNGFGENGHPHPRRFYIFIQKYFNEIRYFMSEKERTKYVFPWVVATRSERLKALNISKDYYLIKKATLKLAKLKLQHNNMSKFLKK